MKTTLIYSLAVVLAVGLAATGCKHKTPPLTPMHASMTPPPPESPFPPIIPPSNQINTEPIPGAGGGIPMANSEDMYGMVPDRAALAAYTVHFAYDSSVIRKSEQSSLQSVAQALAADPKTKLLVEGNCDERGTEEYNRSLGERRALAAREALVKLGIDPMRVFTRSYGKDKPADTGHDDRE